MSAKKNEILTHREREVLSLVAEGFSNVQIAERLNLSHHTIAVHRQNILKKAEVNNAVQLIVWGIENGYL